MKLITEKFEALFKDYPLYSQEHEKDPIMIAKLLIRQAARRGISPSMTQLRRLHFAM